MVKKGTAFREFCTVTAAAMTLHEIPPEKRGRVSKATALSLLLDCPKADAERRYKVWQGQVANLLKSKGSDDRTTEPVGTAEQAAPTSAIGSVAAPAGRADADSVPVGGDVSKGSADGHVGELGRDGPAHRDDGQGAGVVAPPAEG